MKLRWDRTLPITENRIASIAVISDNPDRDNTTTPLCDSDVHSGSGARGSIHECYLACEHSTHHTATVPAAPPLGGVQPYSRTTRGYSLDSHHLATKEWHRHNVGKVHSLFEAAVITSDYGG